MNMNTCGCTLSALQVLMRVEQVGSTTVALETSLEVMETAEVRCLAVLNCVACRQRRFSLASLTVIGATITEWVRKVWFHDGDTATSSGTISLGDYNLDAADAKTLSYELMSLQLSRFSEVMNMLLAALSTMATLHTHVYHEIVSSQLLQLQELAQRINSPLGVHFARDNISVML